MRRLLSGTTATESALDDGGQDVLQGIAGRLIRFDHSERGEFVDDDGQELGQEGQDLAALKAELTGKALDQFWADGGLQLTGFDRLVGTGAYPRGNSITEACLIEFFEQAVDAADLIEQSADGF